MGRQSKTFKQIVATQRGQLERLLDKVEELKILNETVSGLLEPALVPHCQVANLRSGCLVLMADSAAWATRLRYSFPDLLSRLRFEARLFNITALQCVVQKEKLTIQKPVKDSPLKLSSENAKLFASMAQEESDPDLANALRKLSTRDK